MEANDLKEVNRLFAPQYNRFRLAATVLLSCEKCAEAVLTEALGKAELAYIAAGFEFAFTMRTVAGSAIAHAQKCPESSSSHSASLSTPGSNPVAVVIRLPWPERTAFFLREVLNYSKRDSSLLMGMNDSNVEQMVDMAHKRLAAMNGVCLDSLKAWYRHELFEYAAFTA